MITCITPDRRQSKTPQQSTNADQKSLETVFSIAICRQSVDKWQSKTLFLMIFVSTFVDSINVFDCRLSGVCMVYGLFQNMAKITFFEKIIHIN